MTTFRAIFKTFQLFPISLTTQTVNLSATLTKQSKSFMDIAENFKRSTTFSGNYISVLCDHLKNQRLQEARALFDKIPFSNVRLLTKMISCYVENCRLEEALKLFDKMPDKDTVLWNLMIKGCIDWGNLEMGLRLFSEMPEKNVVSCTTVMNGLLKFGRVEEAKRLFEEMPVRDIAAWNAMIHGYFENGRVEEALTLFDGMPNRNVISWTSIISGLGQHGRNCEALSIFWKMVGLGMRPTSSTFACAITACANIGELCLGSQVHGLVMKLGCVFDVYVIASLITLYANCKEMNYSFKVFDEKLHMNVVTWTSLLTGYSVNGKHGDALKVFGDMIRVGVIPNQSSFTSALNSCCEMKAVAWGKEIHGAAIKLGFERDVYVGNTLVLLYTACGNISNGLSKFNEIAEKNIVSWNTIIVGCAQHGYGKWALTLFSQMVKARVDPDDITFTGLLNACSHSGMLREGICFFEYLCQCTAMEKKLEHFACMVDVLCRNGKLDEAEELVKTMPIEANLSIWLALLNGCRMHSNLEVAERACSNILDIDPRCSAAYVLLSNTYASAGRWADVSRIRKNMKNSDSIKQPGCSWVTEK
ncbi:pentatricopeptide repeat-containing protein At5g46460, mitochondrial [Olea europaea var. sylvestris]|uniref:pentatricopeptide repeat-containing protein At5g46460, mitochondrial n=1 Tax=Olea europaea var. sylvestris TaxID=158386 RepID=UPI000C1D6D1A|nr:pentatricopeptide repeat-containing protein At5g46460, mitochondrial [Olea europaea var. sylvestris]